MGLPSSVVGSQEVWGGAPIGDDPVFVRDGVEKLGIPAGPIVERQDGRNVPAPVAVVGRRPDRDQVLVGEHVLVALLDQLVGPADELEPVDVAELFGRRVDVIRVPAVAGKDQMDTTVSRQQPAGHCRACGAERVALQRERVHARERPRERERVREGEPRPTHPERHGAQLGVPPW